ncbi:uncharacterized protein LOC135102167 isoform X2 [Scylla paramamosain]|uniref:uncharacterized protein LOC135102167 isoform X2 n=1 Tax=Scylla paramamosain TaxID=85552 RepID=UPI003083536C
MCASINLSQLRLSVRRLEQEIAEPCCREERMAGGAAVNTPNTCRRKERMAGGAAVSTPNTCRRKERMAGGAAVNTPNTCRRKVSTCFITSCALYFGFFFFHFNGNLLPAFLLSASHESVKERKDVLPWYRVSSVIH